MLLVEGVAEAHDRGGTAWARVDPDAWYADPDGAMPAWFGLELLAQAVAACRGRALAEAGLGPRGGYLVAVRDYRSDLGAFPPGARLELAVRLDEEAPSGLRKFSCAILMDGFPVARGALTLVERP
jgi:predicted hotdog family 3-hydroxylacyl-ACP dehydratase